MKKPLSTIAFLTSLALSTSAQHFEEGGKYLNLGIGIGSPYFYSGSDMVVPPMHASFEVGVTDVIGVGGLIGYASSKYDEYYFSDSYSWKFSYLVIGARGAYHFYNEGEWDAYGGVMLGYNATSTSFESSDPDLEAVVSEPDAGGVVLGAFIGGRYYLSESSALFGELGYNIAWLSVGYCAKF